jgi:hypothetical protein
VLPAPLPALPLPPAGPLPLPVDPPPAPKTTPLEDDAVPDDGAPPVPLVDVELPLLVVGLPADVLLLLEAVDVAAPLLEEELLELPPQAVLQLLLAQLANATNGPSEPQDAGGLVAVTQVMHVWSLAHACSCAQQDVLRQLSQVGSLVVNPQPMLPLDVDEELELALVLDDVALALVLEELLVPVHDCPQVDATSPTHCASHFVLQQ